MAESKPEENQDDQSVSTDGRSWALEGNDTSAYVGVSPEYRNYANETEKPILTQEERKQMKDRGLKTDVERESSSVTAEDRQLPHRDDDSQDIKVASAQGDVSETAEESSSADPSDEERKSDESTLLRPKL